MLQPGGDSDSHKQGGFSVCPFVLQKTVLCVPLCCKELVLCVPFLHGCGQHIQANVPGPTKQNVSPREASEAPRRSWRPGQEEHPGPENQDNQHRLNQPRGSFPAG